MKIWPNPVTDFVNITYIAPATTTIDVSILNSLGKTVRQSGYAVSRGLNQVSVFTLYALQIKMQMKYMCRKFQSKKTTFVSLFSII